MTAPRMLRSLAAALFAVCVGFAALPGCAPDKKSDPKKDENKDKKDDPKPDPNAPKPDGTTPPKPETPPKTTLGAVEKDADDAATAFRKSVLDGTVKADMLSASFVKAIGKPMVFPNDSDKGRGYQPNVAESWLKQVGNGIGFGPEMKREQAGDVAYFRGALLQKPGGYCLRMVKEGGAWKADWLSISSVDGTVTTTPTPEGAAQAFAVASFVELAADASNMQPGERAAVLAAALTPGLRAAWAATSFDQDKAAGLDYTPATLARKAGSELGAGASAYTAARVGDLPEFKVELTKPAGKKTYTVKLVKGTAAHEWLVSEVSEAKG